MKKFLLTVLGLCLINTSAMAETITREAVDTHLKSMVDLYNQKPVNIDSIYNFIENYTVDDVLYRSEIYINGSDVPVVTSKNREQSLRGVNEMDVEYSEASGRHEILEYTAETDTSRAKVKYKVWHDGTIEKQLPQNQIGKISFKSIAECTETFALEGAQIKGYGNDCKVIMNQAQPVTQNAPQAQETKTP